MWRAGTGAKGHAARTAASGSELHIFLRTLLRMRPDVNRPDVLRSRGLAGFGSFAMTTVASVRRHPTRNPRAHVRCSAEEDVAAYYRSLCAQRRAAEAGPRLRRIWLGRWLRGRRATVLSPSSSVSPD